MPTRSTRSHASLSPGRRPAMEEAEEGSPASSSAAAAASSPPRPPPPPPHRRPLLHQLLVLARSGEPASCGATRADEGARGGRCENRSVPGRGGYKAVGAPALLRQKRARQVAGGGGLARARVPRHGGRAQEEAQLEGGAATGRGAPDAEEAHQPPRDAATVLAALRTCNEFFAARLLEGTLRAKPCANKTADNRRDESAAELDASEAFTEWLQGQYGVFRAQVQALLVSDEFGEEVSPKVQIEALSSVLQAVRLYTPNGALDNVQFGRTVGLIISSKSTTGELIGTLVNYLKQYDDLRYYTYVAVSNVVDSVRSEVGEAEKRNEVSALFVETITDRVRLLYDLLFYTPAPPSSQDVKDGGHSWTAWASDDGTQGEDEEDGNPSRTKKRRKTAHAAVPQARACRWKDVNKQRIAFSNAWIALLRLGSTALTLSAPQTQQQEAVCVLPREVFRKALACLHDTVIPHMHNPLLLCDLLTDSYNSGGLIALLALNGLYILISQHGLEYPTFYPKLYSLLQPGVFTVRYRARFFELMDLFLRSSHLPQYLVAAFIKRMARLALAAPPSGALVAIVFIHNLLIRHPSCSVLIHRDDSSLGGVDPYLEDEVPEKCRAISSSLWELKALEQHYCPMVAGLVPSLSKDLGANRGSRNELDVKDYARASYATLFDELSSKRLKQKNVPLAFYVRDPKHLFGNRELFGQTGGHVEEDFGGWKFNVLEAQDVNEGVS
eukprot:scaffold3068_cov401-Prasinococcus_capsulatus_cf.AAC.48